MYTSFADMLAKNPLTADKDPEAKPAQPPVVLENLSITDEEGRQCCPNCRTPFLGLGPTCYYC